MGVFPNHVVNWREGRRKSISPFSSFGAGGWMSLLGSSISFGLVEWGISVVVSRPPVIPSPIRTP